jgi:hypothetical protein
MKNEQKIVSLFGEPKLFSSYLNKDTPVYQQEKAFIVITTFKSPLYTNMYDQLNIYVDKISDSYKKKYLKSLLDNKVIYFGRDLSSSKNGVIGTAVLKNNELGMIVLDILDAGIDFKSGECNDIDLCADYIYYMFIRASAVLNSIDIKKNDALIDSMSEYVYELFSRYVFEQIVPDSYRRILKIVSRYYVKHFLMGELPPLALEYAFTGFEDMKNTIEPKINTDLSAPQEIFNIMYDLRLIQDNPKKAALHLLIKLSIVSFNSVFTYIDYLIAGSIVSLYNKTTLNKLLINESFQTNIEKQMVNYFAKVKINPSIGFNF